jgi:hypothetical protein
MRTLLAPFSALLQAIRRAAQRLRVVVTRLAGRLRQDAALAWARHTRRLRSDRPYRRTLTAALAALATTLLPHPPLAAALGAWLAEPPPTRWDLNDEDPDDAPPWRGPHRWDAHPRP